MTCSLNQSLLEDYLDGDLPEATRLKVESHLADHPECREELESSQQLKELLSRLDCPEPGPEYWAELRELIAARTVERTEQTERVVATPSRKEIRRSFYRSLVSVAAGLALFGSALLLGSSGEVEVKKTTPTPEAYASLSEMINRANARQNQVFTASQQDRISGGMLLVGPVGLLGRLSELTGVHSLE